jgi:hypothetical protein
MFFGHRHEVPEMPQFHGPVAIERAFSPDIQA